ncbi:MAG: GGDEF domain-containing protein [Candidatus Saccharibacteria bacterium]|nr:GGDEF domain-containing protein [Candidatus Saccharibacteria bacterium]
MILANYFIVAGISVLCIIVSLLHLGELDLIEGTAIKRMRVLAFFIIAEIAIDTLFKALEGNPNVSTMFLQALKCIEFAMSPILPFLILRLFRNKHSTAVKRVLVIQAIIIVANMALQIVSLFGDIMFTIDVDNIYHRTNFTPIYVACLIVSVGLMLFAMNAYSNKVQKSNLLTLAGLSLMLVTGFVLRFLFPHTNFDWLCIAICFFVIDIYYVDLVLRLDPLTQLLNGQIYTTIKKRINFSTVVFMVDANNLKGINDTFGHSCGDQTLCSIAKCILKAYGDYGWCFRLHGDEYCVILKPDAFRRLVASTDRYDIFAMAEGLVKRMNEIVAERAEKDKQSYLQFGVSQGYGVYYDPSEYPNIENNMPLEKVFKLADRRMYEDKEKNKHRCAEIQATIRRDNGSKHGPKRSKVFYPASSPELIKPSDDLN